MKRNRAKGPPPAGKALSGGASQIEPNLSLWVVAFLDLLGYRSLLNKMDVFPLPEDDAGQRTLSKSLGDAVKRRRRLLGTIDQFMKGAGKPPPEFEKMQAGKRRLAEAWRNVRLVNMPGPDHIVLGCSLAPKADHLPMRAVYTLVTTACAAMMMQLMMGGENPTDTLPLRGGLDLAAGSLIEPENFLYSPALTRAYELESLRARYPRILVGERLVSYIRTVAVSRDDDFPSQYSRALAERLLQFIFEDEDGLPALDFLGEAMRQLLDPDLARQVGEGIRRYAHTAYAHAVQHEEAKVVAKYEWLLKYAEPRLPLWCR